VIVKVFAWLVPAGRHAEADVEKNPLVKICERDFGTVQVWKLSGLGHFR
jgi:hypothetical protein